MLAARRAIYAAAILTRTLRLLSARPAAGATDCPFGRTSEPGSALWGVRGQDHDRERAASPRLELGEVGARVAICAHNSSRSAPLVRCASTSCSRSRIRMWPLPAALRFRNHCGVRLEAPIPAPTTM